MSAYLHLVPNRRAARGSTLREKAYEMFFPNAEIFPRLSMANNNACYVSQSPVHVFWLGGVVVFVVAAVVVNVVVVVGVLLRLSCVSAARSCQGRPPSLHTSLLRAPSPTLHLRRNGTSHASTSPQHSLTVRTACTAIICTVVLCHLIEFVFCMSHVSHNALR